MKLKTFVNIFGEIAVGLQHAMVEAAHKRFLSFFEDPDKDGTYEAKKHLLKLAVSSDISRTVRVLVVACAQRLKVTVSVP